VVEPRVAWVTVILIAGLGLVNYILWKLYGSHGIELTGFLGGLVHSRVAVSELAQRVRDTQSQMLEVAYRGMVLAITAMLVRNAVLLALLAPAALASAAVALLLMLVASLGLAFWPLQGRTDAPPTDTPVLRLAAPFSLTAAFKFGVILLLIQVASALAQHTLGQLGVFAISLLGGLFSSASAVAAAATLGAPGTITPQMAGVCAVIASLTSVVVNVPLALAAHARPLMQRLVWAVGIILVVGAMGIVAQGAGSGVAHRLVHAWGSLSGIGGHLSHRRGGRDVPHAMLFDLDETLIGGVPPLSHQQRPPLAPCWPAVSHPRGPRHRRRGVHGAPGGAQTLWQATAAAGEPPRRALTTPSLGANAAPCTGGRVDAMVPCHGGRGAV
jgi:hypothetical protein